MLPSAPEDPMLTLPALLATGSARVEAATPFDTGKSVADDGCGKSSLQGAVSFSLLITIGDGITVGRREP